LGRTGTAAHLSTFLGIAAGAGPEWLLAPEPKVFALPPHCRPATHSQRSCQPDLEPMMISSRLNRFVFLAAAAALAGLLVASGAEAQTTVKQAAQTKVTKTAPAAMHKVAIQVNQNDKAVMDLALNNAKNVLDYYKEKGETVAIEIVTYGPGLHMLRADTSPVKERIAPMSLENPNLAFIACGNTQANQAKAEGKPVKLISEAKVMPSGVVRLMELQKQGYAYIRP
jgi:intracellular sulfur oxidation DsrE/DsrF family protein